MTRPAAREVPASATILARERVYRLLLATADVLASSVALLVIAAVGGATLAMPALLVPVAMVVLAKLSGLYDRDELLVRRSTLDEVPRLFHLATLATLTVAVGGSAFVHGALRPSVTLLLWALLLTGSVLSRWAARSIAMSRTPPERCLLIGDEPSYARLLAKLEGDRSVDVVGRVPLEDVLLDLPELERIADVRAAHRLIVATPTAGTHEETMNLIRGAKATGLRVSLIPGILEVVGSSVEFDHLPGLTLLGVKRFGLSRSSGAIKRTFDLTGAGLALLAFSPIMGLVALAVRLGSPGPVLFRQTRVGRDGQRFEIFKFRTMVDGAEAMRAELFEHNEGTGGLFKIAADPRITGVGRLLRRTSLDELPQLLNVMRGEMSLVGPRPLVVDEDEQVTGFDRRRLVLTPGMTGPWQVASGSDRVSLSEMVKMDYIYVAGWSLWGDIKICARTCRYMVSARGQ